jgi:hypothetical protein
MRAKTFHLLILFWTLAIVSCNKAAPASFWENYKYNYLIKNISDQGPNGGHRAMYWDADQANVFQSSNVLRFAKKNRWTIIDSSAYNQNQINKWTYDSKAIFPLTSGGFSDTLLNDAQLEEFPRWFGGPVEVYKFKTGWVTIKPGTDNSIEENEFVIINDDKRQMAVYHLWGE